MRIDHINIVVADMTRRRVSYAGLLGMNVTFEAELTGAWDTSRVKYVCALFRLPNVVALLIKFNDVAGNLTIGKCLSKACVAFTRSEFPGQFINGFLCYLALFLSRQCRRSVKEMRVVLSLAR